ncbi:NAD(P)H-dependent oxidoreductase [Mesorhizobium sp. 2RAF21]|uniref:NAD(P)H-dependent oxidoreductase n=1 Tax=Mesorhizobium sp. 2RAF21 TaxID=3232995 RepID=UPI003F96B48F
MRVFVVHAHPEPKSFSGAMTGVATEALRAAGHEVVVSDLYAMGFNPISDRGNFTTVADPHYYRQTDEEAYAAKRDGFAADIQQEMDKLFWCDTLILQFPLWWVGFPAILKGWVDRVFAAGGRIYGNGRWYDQGIFVGKRAMCSVTLGGPESMVSEDGLNGPIDSLLFPINHGILYFTGFSVVDPFLVYAPARIADDERQKYLARYRETVLGIGSAPTIQYPGLEAYDSNFVLKRA